MIARELDERLDHAIRLFQFLARVQQVKSPPPRTTDAYKRDGDVIWLHGLPSHPAVVTPSSTAGLEPDDAILTVDRVPRLAPPDVPRSMQPWVEGEVDDPTRVPQLRKTAVLPQPVSQGGTEADDLYAEQASATVVESLDEHPEVVQTFRRWLPGWQAWATDELAARPVRELYSRLFSSQVAAAANPEELELVYATACLSWTPDGHLTVQRHLLTSPVDIDFDDDTGRLTVRLATGLELLTVELDMVEPGLVRDPHRVAEICEHAQSLEMHPLDRDQIGLFGRRLVHCLDPNGRYLDQEEPASPKRDPLIAYAPALILRKRSQQGLIRIFETVADQLRSAGQVPEGILPLVEPNHVPDPGLSWDGKDGAMVAVDDEVFLPLPVNEAQLNVIRRVDQNAQTLVQGPPGTGKTHTIAALIAHLVAQGKRELVTAQTDRALKEVRDKLPASIQPLSVAVVGAAREDMSQLKVAVERIAQEAADYSDARADREIASHLATIDQLRQRRAELHHNLIAARETEVRRYDIHGYSGTLAAIAQAHQADEPRFRWIGEFCAIRAADPCPLNDDEIIEWRTHLLDEHLRANETEASRDLLEPSLLPEPAAFADAVERERRARAADGEFAGVHDYPAFPLLTAINAMDRDRLSVRLKALAHEGTSLRVRHENWIPLALTDIQRHRASTWQARHEQLRGLVTTATPLVEQLGSIIDVHVSVNDPAFFLPLARALLGHLRDGGKVRTDAAGRPKLGLFTSAVVKQAVPLFDAVRIAGVPPTTAAHLERFLTWFDATQALDALDLAWPAGTEIPAEDTLSGRLHWHVTELAQLARVLRFAADLEAYERELAAFGLPPGTWTGPDEITLLARLLEAAAAREALVDASRPLTALEECCRQASRWADAAPCVRSLHDAVLARNANAYRVAFARLSELWRFRGIVARRDELGARLVDAAPALHAALLADPSEPQWNERLVSFSAAWRWAAAGSWLQTQEQVDLNEVKAQLDSVETEIRRHVEGLIATRAWRHATSAERITGEARANLQHYAQLVRRLGKGTGRYAGQRRADIRTAMDRCRPSVPVWILPLYRIAEQLRVAPGMFDVVIVDEASQAGLEATFLQYLAPKIVVVGDDKQVSPTAVGVEEQQLRNLADQYLYDDPYRPSWADPRRSLFDEAKMRYGGLITLVEHRRCVPEIIGFSNRVAYEPDGIRLIPVRQYGADRLEPIKPVYLPDGYTKGDRNRVNPVEVEAIVNQIEKCLAEPRYNGLTFGIISLLGTAQAKVIERALLERIPPEEWSARDLRCGDSADFQGSERDVIFLSMVAAPEPGRRMAALTQEMHLQRYNVAASRAKDQMWLFHSVSLDELGNPEDLRFALLDYCYGVINRPSDPSAGRSTPVPEDIRVEPFESLFEQRVFNRLVDRGYSTIPQYEVEGYRIDLVVVGPHCKLAVECDGDAWHGADRYEADLARQRDLERCGWQFFRIPEFRFYVDPAAALAPLWELLDELDIHPSGWARTLVSVEPHAAPMRLSHSSLLLSQALVSGVADSDLATLASSNHIGAVDPLSGTPSEDVEPIGELDDECSDEFGCEDFGGHGDEPATASLESGGSREVVRLASTDGAERTSTRGGRLRTTMARYGAFCGQATPALAATRAQLVDEVLEIVAVEGPVVGERLHQAHVQASRGQRVGRQIARALNSAIARAVSRGLLVEDNPLGDQGVKPKTYRLPSQAAYVIRDRGPRSLQQIPPAELALVMAEAAQSTGWANEESLFRATLERYGWVRLGSSVVAHLRRIKLLAEKELILSSLP